MSAGGERPDLWALGSKWISLGMVEGDGGHGADESVEIDALVQHAQLHMDLALRMLR